MNTPKKYILTAEQQADAQRLKALFDQREPKISQSEFARLYELGSQSSVTHYLNARAPLNLMAAIKFAVGLKVSIAAFSPTLARQIIQAAALVGDPQDQSFGVRPYTFNFEYGAGNGIYDIPYLKGKGPYADTLHNVLRKDLGFFERYELSPKDVVAFYQEDPSMEAYLSVGDTAIVDTRITQPQTGQVFLIQHTGGERIRRLRQELDGSWVLGTDHVNKSLYPDERVLPEQAKLMQVLGRVAYREG
jgi:hypothetical protein